MRDGGHKIIGKDDGMLSEDRLAGGSGEADERESNAELEGGDAQVPSSGGKKFKSWIKGETLEPDVGGEVYLPLSETRKRKGDVESVEDPGHNPRKLPRGFSGTTFLPAGYQPKPLPSSTPQPNKDGPPPLLSRNEQLAKAFGDEDEDDDALTLTKAPVKRLTKFKFNIRK